MPTIDSSAAPRVAKVIYENARAMVPGHFRVEEATPRTHPHVAWHKYADARNQIEALGFVHVADVDPVSVHQDPSMMKRAVLAVFVGPDGTEVFGHYRVVLRWTLKGIIGRLLGFARHGFFDIGTVFEEAGEEVLVTTTTAAAAGVWDQPPFVVGKIFQPGTPLATLLDNHRQRVREYRAAHPLARAVVARTESEIFRTSDAFERRKREWRKGRGWASRAEIGRFARTDGPALDRMYAELQALAEADADS
jgi:hypothetical protein